MEGATAVVVYVDVVFLLNFLTDLAWIFAAGSLAGVRRRFWWQVAAAGVGALLAVWAYFPSGRWLTSLPGLLLGSVGMVWLAFRPQSLAAGIRLAGYLAVSGAAMAGMSLVVGLRTMGAGHGIVVPLRTVPGTLVAVGMAITLAGGRVVWDAFRQRASRSRAIYQLRVVLGEGKVEVNALLDTGNALRDPLSGLPVAVVEAAALEQLVPPGMARAAAAWDGLEQLPEGWARRCRLVPFRAVGQRSGVLLAFTPDAMAIRHPGLAEWQSVMAMVAVAADPLESGGQYQALLPAQVADRLEQDAENRVGG